MLRGRHCVPRVLNAVLTWHSALREEGNHDGDGAVPPSQTLLLWLTSEFLGAARMWDAMHGAGCSTVASQVGPSLGGSDGGDPAPKRRRLGPARHASDAGSAMDQQLQALWDALPVGLGRRPAVWIAPACCLLGTDAVDAELHAAWLHLAVTTIMPAALRDSARQGECADVPRVWGCRVGSGGV